MFIWFMKCYLFLFSFFTLLCESRRDIVGVVGWGYFHLKILICGILWQMDCIIRKSIRKCNSDISFFPINQSILCGIPSWYSFPHYLSYANSVSMTVILVYEQYSMSVGLKCVHIWEQPSTCKKMKDTDQIQANILMYTWRIYCEHLYSVDNITSEYSSFSKR